MAETHPKPLPWEKVYIFVSSTFNDMHADRDYLVKRVFPELQDWCEQRKLRLVDIDLRWGVTEQDATHNKNVVKVCLNRIDDCRPFFLCFLGQRRGWVPKEEEVSAETFEAFTDLRSHVGASSVTEMEILHALINPLHRRLPRDAARPAEYYEPAKYAFFYLRGPSYLDQLPADPPMLRETYTNEWIEEAAERERHVLALKKWREIDIPDSNRPFHFYEAKWEPSAVTPELMLPLQCPSTEPANIERWRRQWQKAGVTVTGLDIEGDPVEASKAREFNSRLQAGRLSDFKCEEAPLSKLIIGELQEAIAERYPDHAEVEHEDELQKEIDQQEQFLFAGSEGFIEREGDFAELDDYAESESNKLFVLTAAGGMGKSTLLANWVDRYRRRIEGGVEGRADHSIHFRFIGQSDGTTTVYSLLRLLLAEIKEVAQKFDEEIPLDPVKLRNEWPALLEAIGKRGKTVIVIDALNQLESGLTDVGWLPRQLPDNIKLIVSFKRGDPSAEELYERFSEGNQVRLSEVKPFENLDDRRRLVRAYLSQYLKELDAAHLETLINLRGAENPLYLKVVLSELRVFGAYGNLAAKIGSDFGDNPVSAFVRVLERLENDPAYSPMDPKLAVPLLFGLLSHARRGLSVDELTSLFIQARGLEEKEEWREAAADTVNLFLRQVRSFLARREGRYDFFFDSFKIAAQRRYVAGTAAEVEPKRTTQHWHRLLANYFCSLSSFQELPASSEMWSARKPTIRRISELPYHQTQGEQWDELEQTLCDLEFVEAKCLGGMIYDLEADYEQALRVWPGSNRHDPFARSLTEASPDGIRESVQALLAGQLGSALDKGAGPILTLILALRESVHAVQSKSHSHAQEKHDWPTDGLAQKVFEEIASSVSKEAGEMELVGSRKLEAFKSFISGNTHILAGRPEGTAYCAFNYANRGPVVAAAWERLRGEAALPNTSLILAQRPAFNLQPSLLRTLDAHEHSITAIKLSGDGRLAVSSDRQGTLRAWDGTTGECVQVISVKSRIASICLGASGAVLMVGAEDGEIMSWNTTAWQPSLLRESGSTIRSMVLTSDDVALLAGRADGLVEIWDVRGRRMARQVRFGSEPVNVLAASSDGRLALTPGDQINLCIWDMTTGTQLAELAGHSERIRCISLAPNGRMAATGGDDWTVRIWDLQRLACVGALKGHSSRLASVWCSPGGRLVVSAGRWDRTLIVWNATECAPLRAHSTQQDLVTCAATQSGRVVFAGYGSGLVRVWDIAQAATEEVS